MRFIFGEKLEGLPQSFVVQTLSHPSGHRLDYRQLPTICSWRWVNVRSFSCIRILIKRAGLFSILCQKQCLPSAIVSKRRKKILKADGNRG